MIELLVISGVVLIILLVIVSVYAALTGRIVALGVTMLFAMIWMLIYLIKGNI